MEGTLRGLLVWHVLGRVTPARRSVIVDAGLPWQPCCSGCGAGVGLASGSAPRKGASGGTELALSEATTDFMNNPG